MPRALANADALGPQLDNTLHPDIVQLVWNELANLIENPEVGEIIWDGPDEIDAIHHLPGDLSAIRISYSYTPEGNYMAQDSRSYAEPQSSWQSFFSLAELSVGWRERPVVTRGKRAF